MSNINNITGPYDQQTYINETAEKKQQVRPETDALNKKDANEDRVSLSASYREMSLAKQAAMESPGPPPVSSYDRAGKLAEIKKEVESGQYQTNHDLAAEKIIGLVIDEVV